jgi:hypothetical protein
MAGAFLLACGEAATPRAAVEMLRAARPSIIIRPQALRALQDYHQVREPVEAIEMGCELIVNG